MTSRALMRPKHHAFAEPGVQPHFAPSWTFRISHYHLTLDLFPQERRWSGVARISIDPLVTFGGTVTLDLEAVHVDSVRNAEGEDLPFSVQEASLVVEAREARVLVVHFRGEDPQVGLYTIEPSPSMPQRGYSMWTQCQDEDAHFIFPCLDHPRIRHPWTVVLSGPAEHTLVCNGVCVRDEVSGDRRTSTWDVADAVPPYLFTAISADLDIFEAADSAVPVRYLVPKGTPEHLVMRSMQRTPQMIAAYANFLHTPYAWPRYDQVVVHDFIFGGMENTGATTMTDLLLVDDKVGPHWGAEDLVSHELAHQWFGDLVTCQDWSQAWLNESFATFMETVWRDAGFGRDEGTWHAVEQFRAYLDEDKSRYRRAIESYHFREPIDLFDRHLYEKGAVIVRMLRAKLGVDAFRAGLALYLSRHAHDAVHARHLQRALEDATGVNLDGFFTDFIRSPGHPVLVVTVSGTHALLKVSVQQTQSGDGVPEAYALDLPVEIVSEDGTSRTITLAIRTRQHTFHVPTYGKATRILVDPHFEVFADLSLKMDLYELSDLALTAPPALAARAVSALRAKGGKTARKGLAAAALHHPFWGVRIDALRNLAEIGVKDQDMDTLVAVLHDSQQDPRVRAAAAVAIGSRRHDTSAKSLLDVLSDDLPTWHLIAAVLEGLGCTRDPAALAEVAKWLNKPSWGSTVLKGAIQALTHSKDSATLQSFIRRLQSSNDDRERGIIAAGIATLGSNLASVRSLAREQLIDLARQGGFRTALAAIDGLGRLGDPAALSALADLHASAPDGRLRRTAYEASARLQRSQGAGDRLSTLTDRIDEIDARTREAIDRLGDLSRRV